MKIGVVVSTYNRPDALVRVLEGLAGQSMPPHEVIVADDGSTDRTRAALGPFLAGTGLNLSHVWQADKGFRLARIRNRAIRESVCDYLVFLDGDCIPHPDFVSDHAALARKGYFFQGKRVIVGQQATPGFTAAHTRSALRLLCMALSGRISNAHHILRLPFYPGHTTTRLSGVRGCNMGFFRSDLEAVNGFNEAFEGWGRRTARSWSGFTTMASAGQKIRSGPSVFTSGIPRRSAAGWTGMIRSWKRPLPKNTRSVKTGSGPVPGIQKRPGKHRCRNNQRNHGKIIGLYYRL